MSSQKTLRGTNNVPGQKTIFQSHAIAIYFLSTFIISWGGIFAVVSRDGFPGTPAKVESLLPWVVLAMLAGPSVTGVGMTCLTHGWPGFKRLLWELIPQWQNGARLWVVALLLAPLTIATILVTLSRADPMYLPVIFASDDKAKTMVTAFTYAFAAGFFEELGWTAFVIHELRSRNSILATGLMVGIVWGAWHLLVAVWGSSKEDEPGVFSATIFLPQILFYAAVLPAYRILMVWIYDRTGSISAAMVMHASLTASLPLALAPSATGLNLALAYLVLAVVLWGGIAVATSTGAFSSSTKQQELARYGMLLCGATSTVLYIAFVLLSSTGRKINDTASQWFIELTGLNALSRAQIGPLLVTYSLLMVFFVVGLGTGT